MSCNDSVIPEDIVTTIYVNGFPDDFKEREFQNLFFFAKGYEGCSLRIPSSSEGESSGSSPLLRCFHAVPRGQILGFAKFRSLQDALDACRVLNGRVVDAERGSVLRAEMAKKNLVLSQVRSKAAPPQHDTPIFGPALTRRASAPTATTIYPATKCSNCNGCETSRSLNLSIPGQAAPVSVAAPGISSRDSSLSLSELAVSVSASASASASASSTFAAVKPSSLPSTSTASMGMGGALFGMGGTTLISPENPPCNTLYVGNLPPTASEMELRTIFGNCPGFRRLNFKPKIGGSPMCFVEFEDVRAATVAMESLYGTMLSNSTKGGIRLSYSKNPLGVRPAPPMSTFLGSSLYADLFAPLPDLRMRDFLPADLTPFNRLPEHALTPGN